MTYNRPEWINNCPAEHQDTLEKHDRGEGTAIFYKADFTGANLEGASLNGAILNDCCFDNVNFRDASLIGADFMRSSLKNTNFTEADLSNTILTDAFFDNTKFINAIVAGAQYKDDILHLPPLNIEGWGYSILLIGSYINISCKCFKTQEWIECSEEDIRRMDPGKSLKWAQEFKETLLPIATDYLEQHNAC